MTLAGLTVGTVARVSDALGLGGPLAWVGWLLTPKKKQNFVINLCIGPIFDQRTKDKKCIFFMIR